MRSRITAIVIGAAILGGGGYAVTQGGGGGGGSGSFSLFIAASGCTNTPTRLSSPVDFPDATSGSKACTIDQACDAANAGDHIGWLNGTYSSSQTVSCTKGVTVTGQSVTGVISTAEVDLDDNITIENATGINDAHHFTPWGVSSTDGVTLRNVRAEGDYVEQIIRAATNFVWDGGRLGDFDGSIQTRKCNDGGGVNHRDGEPLHIGVDANNHSIIGDDVTLKGITFSDFQPEGVTADCGGNDDFHLEAIRIDGPVNDVKLFRNFIPDTGANSAQIFITNFEAGTPTNVKIVGNYIGDSPTTTISMQNVGGCANYLVAYNTFKGHIGTWTCPSYTGVKFVGNIHGSPSSETPSCSDIAWIDNVSQSQFNKNCATGDDTGNQWTTGSNYQIGNLGVTSDGHLQAGSLAINAGETPGGSALCGDAALGLDKDIDGDARPTGGSKCDAGADEYTAG